MAKKNKKGPVMQAWCWYCDREFEDEKVLLQHQKAKHYRCPQCPRRLNTAGGLAVHLQQVHKAEPGRLENTLPGRDSFDIEIYGMEGIPAGDLMAWKARKAAEAAANDQAGAQMHRPSKKAKIDKRPIPAEVLKAQLEAHKALMSGRAPPPGALSALAALGPPPGVGFAGPPPGFPFSGPPPPITGPPPGFAANGPPPGVPPPGMFAPPGAAAAPAQPPQPSPHQRAVKDGAKSRVVYSDSALSPEEKLAQTGKYLYLDPENPEDAQKIQAMQQASMLPGWQARGPPPGFYNQPPPPHPQQQQAPAPTAGSPPPPQPQQIDAAGGDGAQGTGAAEEADASAGMKRARAADLFT